MRIGTTESGKAFSLPKDAAVQTFAFIARKGAGKTYAAGVVAEGMMDAGIQTVVLDLVGNWWGLRLAADGKTPGYDVPVIGGLRGDIPLEASGGALIADIVADTGRSLVIDISQFSKADRQRFATAFAERLWARKKAEHHPSPVHLIIEESQLIVPEAVKGDTAKMVGIYEEIIRLGRNYGIGVTMISQRPQSVNKEVLNQTECLFVLQVNGAHERKALRDWIVHQGMDKTLTDELPGLPIGTAYVWSPQWLKTLERVKIGEKKTFDSTATPRVGARQVRRELKPLDLADLQAKMAATIERAKADDPKALRAEIASLKKQLSAAPVAKAMPAKTIEKPVIRAAEAKRLEATADKIDAAIEKANALLTSVHGMIVNVRDIPIDLRAAMNPAPVPTPRPMPQPGRAAPVQTPRPDQPSPFTGDEPLTRAEWAILVAARQVHPSPGIRNRLSVLSGYSISSSSFVNAVGALRTKGLLNGRGDDNHLTEKGLARTADVPPAPTGSELLQFWLSKLEKAERAILQVYWDTHPDVPTRELVSAISGYSLTSSSFVNAIGKLRSLELLTGRGDETRLNGFAFGRPE